MNKLIGLILRINKIVTNNAGFGNGKFPIDEFGLMEFGNGKPPPVDFSQATINVFGSNDQKQSANDQNGLIFLFFFISLLYKEFYVLFLVIFADLTNHFSEIPTHKYQNSRTLIIFAYSR